MKAQSYFKSKEGAFGASYFGELAVTRTDEPDPAETLEEYVRTFVQREFDDQLVYANETFYTYRDGYWPALDLRAEVRKTIAVGLGRNATAQLVGAYIALMQDLYAEKGFVEKQGPRLICLSNGALNPETGELVPHCPDFRLRTRLGILWDPNAACSRWTQFLDEVFQGDADKDVKIRCLQEWFGYCLIRDSSLHRFVWLIGSGGNGKSIVLEVLKSVLGEENVSHAHVGSLEDPTVRAELENKLVNVSAELGSGAVLGEHFKQIVSADPVMARRLYQSPFSYTPHVRLICSTNEFPRLSDQTRAFERRAIVLRFNREFGVDNTLLPALLSEKSGILAWAVRGLQELRRRGDFAIPSSSVAEVAQYKKECDSVQLFVEEELHVSPEGRGIEPKYLYERYAAWCRESGYAATNKNTMGKRLSRVGIKQRRSNGQDFWLVEWKSYDRSIPLPSQNISPLRRLAP